MVLSPVGPATDPPRAHVLVATPRSEWFSYWAAAFVVLVMSLILFAIRRYSAPPPPPPPVATDFVEYLAHPAVGIPQGMTYGWAADAKRHSHPDRVTAVRVGARMVDLETASFARKKTAYAAWPGVPAALWAVFHDIPYSNWPIDPTASQRVKLESAHVEASAGEITELLAAAPLGGNAAWAFRRVQDEAWDWVDSEDVAYAHRSSRVLPTDLVELGSWLEASRIAALDGDTLFFAKPAVRAEAAAALRTRKLSDPQRQALREAMALSGARSAADVAALEEALTKALWLLAK